MLRFPDGGLLQSLKPHPTSSQRAQFIVTLTQPSALEELPVYPAPACDRLISALSRIQQATALLEQVTSKPVYKQVTLLNKENTAGVCKRKREAEERGECKKAKVVQQTLTAFVNKV